VPTVRRKRTTEHRRCVPVSGHANRHSARIKDLYGKVFLFHWAGSYSQPPGLDLPGPGDGRQARAVRRQRQLPIPKVVRIDASPTSSGHQRHATKAFRRTPCRNERVSIGQQHAPARVRSTCARKARLSPDSRFLPHWTEKAPSSTSRLQSAPSHPVRERVPKHRWGSL
jgi:hypothetical protein